MTVTANNPPSHLTTLDVLGVGLSVEMFHQSGVWLAMQKNPNGSILPADLSAYPSEEAAKASATEERAAAALASGASHFLTHWPIPSLAVWPHWRNHDLPESDPGKKTSRDDFKHRVNRLRTPANMLAHQVVSFDALFHDHPEDVLELAFQFFEGNPGAPALLLLVSDGDQTRAMTGDMRRVSYWGDGPRKVGSMTESFVALILARRNSVDTYLRPFAGSRETHLYKAGPAKPGFKPSKYLPEAWTAEQIDQFDALPTIAVLHRPIRVSYRQDKDGKPTFDPPEKVKLMSPKKREASFKEGFDTALQEIPGGHPARVFYDAGGPSNGRHVVPLAFAVNASLPDFDLFNPEEGVDIPIRIGDTGAASPFVQWALASMASYQKQDASITVNLRQSEEATITVVTPSEKKPPPKPAKVAAPAKVAPPKAVRPAAPRNVALGARLSSGDECNQSGMWKCDPPDAEAGAIHFLSAGRTLPKVTVARSLTKLQKIRRHPSSEKIAANWTLVSYDTPTAE
jgi:hypothetical protein